MLEPRQVVNQCYILQQRLGEDSFFELWKATAIYSATPFLLRFLKNLPGLEERAEEFRALAMQCYSVASPSIIDFIEVERFDGRLFISSEFDNHSNLRAVLAERPRFKLEHACRFAIEIGQGLDAFHKQNIVYRCLNAENVLLRRANGLVEEIRIQKPGYAPFVDLLPDDKDAILENYGYMAPEAKAGEGGDTRSDTYSLGVHLFRFIAGKFPYGPARARNGSVSPSYIAKALARRGLPEGLTAAIVRSMRRDPRRRQNEILEFIAELRAFMDERRRARLRAGGVDPIAELERLNLGKQRVDAIQAVKSLDTADYFRALSSAPLSVPRGPETFFPIDDFADPAEVDRIEAQEAEGKDDDEAMSSEDYVERAFEEVKGEAASRRPSSRPIEDVIVPAVGIAPTAEAHRAAELDARARAASASPVAEFSSDRAPRRRNLRSAPPLDAGGVSWRRAAAPPLSVVEGMESAFSRSFKGEGAFSFIEEPPPGPDAAAFARVFARFRVKGLVVDLGSLPPGADATDLLRALRAAFADGIARETPASRVLLAKRLALVDSLGAFMAAPLGSLLFGADSEEPDPEVVESRREAATIAQAIAALARRRRPLVLTLRGGERLGPSAHQVLVELARRAPQAPICVFAFYKPTPVPAWHVLSRLRG